MHSLLRKCSYSPNTARFCHFSERRSFSSWQDLGYFQDSQQNISLIDNNRPRYPRTTRFHIYHSMLAKTIKHGHQFWVCSMWHLNFCFHGGQWLILAITWGTVTLHASTITKKACNDCTPRCLDLPMNHHLVALMAISRTGSFERTCTDDSMSTRANTTAQRAQRSACISQRIRVNQLSSNQTAQAMWICSSWGGSGPTRDVLLMP